MRKYLFKNTKGYHWVRKWIKLHSMYITLMEVILTKDSNTDNSISTPVLFTKHAIGDFIITGKTGIKLTPFSGRLFRKEDNFNDAVFEITPDPVFYFNVGVSFNPFTFLKKNK